MLAVSTSTRTAEMELYDHMTGVKMQMRVKSKRGEQSGEESRVGDERVKKGCRASAERVQNWCREGEKLVQRGAERGCRAGEKRVQRVKSGCRAGAERVKRGCREGEERVKSR